MSEPIVSVLMSVYCGERFLGEAVESILGQSHGDFEFIIIDDGSTDSTASILDAYRRGDARVRVFHQGNRGLVASLNRGLGLARGKFIARMDADDIAIKDRLERQIQSMESHPECGAVGGAVEVVDAEGVAVGTLRFPVRDRDIRAGLLAGDCPLCHPAVLMRADVVRSVGGYRAVVVDAEDYDLWLRIADRFQLGNLDRPVLKYRRHSGQVSVQRFRQQALSNLAARTAALARLRGVPDFLQGVTEITPSLLERQGVDEDLQQAALARGYLSCIQSMTVVGEYKIALEKLGELESLPYWKRAENALVADHHLLAARVLQRQGRLMSSILSFIRAVVSRPAILLRPLKTPLRSVWLMFRNGLPMSELRAEPSMRPSSSGEGKKVWEKAN